MPALIPVLVVVGLGSMASTILLVRRHSLRSRAGADARTLAKIDAADDLARLIREAASPTVDRAELSDHLLQFFDHEDDLADSVGAYLATAIHDGEVAVAIVTAEHRRSFELAIASHGIDVAAARDDGSYIALDAAATAAKFMIDGRPNRILFHWVVDQMLRDASRSGRPIRAYGEMAALLWGAGNIKAAVDVEALWKDLLTAVPLSLFCAYPLRAMGTATHREAVQAIRDHHSTMLESGPPRSAVGRPRLARIEPQHVT